MEKYLNEMKNSLMELIAIPSVEDVSKENMPFGIACNDALLYLLDKGNAMGFTAENFEGYAGHILYGSGERIAVLCHLDVVPAGDGWSVPPFAKTEKNGRIYGRGAVDNKGSAIACLYAMKALKDDGFVPKKQITFILGLDEESGWQCMEHYKSKQEMPKTGFSPDADFPVIYAEKGVLSLKITAPVSPDFARKVTSLNGGARANVVCESASFTADRVYSASGIPAHGSTPEKGKNAFKELFTVLNNIVTCDACVFIANHMLSSTDGSTLNLKLCDEQSGNLTTNVGKAVYREKCIEILFDVRYPVTYKIGEILARLNSSLPDNFIVTTEMHHAPLYVEKDSPLVKTLLSCYEKVTGRVEEPIAIGGGTYARVLQEGVAFGSRLCEQEDVVHKCDEYMEISHLLLISKIYKEAIKKLSE